ncbi:MAG: SCP2 domain-containing protein [Woeseiaceae bacterium]
MDTLETLLEPVARVLNRNIREVTRARQLCGELNNTVAAIRVRDSALAMFFVIDDDELTLTAPTDVEPDVIIEGSLLSLARLAAGGDENAIRAGEVQLVGDAAKAQAFRDLLAVARPDLEEELSGIVGDTAAHGIGQLARGFRRWALDARQTMGNNVREYLQEESGAVPQPDEAEAFANEVNELRDDVERLAARIERLRNKD